MIRFHRFVKEDLNSLPELTSLCFGRQAAPAFYFWKYYENPEGEVIAHVAKDENGNLVGFWGMIPDSYYINSEKVTVYHVCDSMTHPRYRRQGIFESLANLGTDELRERGNLLVKVFPGQMAHPAYGQKLGWRDFGRIRPSFKVSLQLQLERIWHRLTPTGGTGRIVESDTIPEDINEIDRLRSTRFPIIKTCNKNYLDWRLREPGLRHTITYCYQGGKLQGYCITCVENKSVLLIKDFFGTDVSVYRELFRRVFEKVSEERLLGVYCWSNTGSVFSKLLRQNLFLKNPFNRGVMSYPLYFSVLADTRTPPGKFIYDPHNWHLLPIDYDG